MANYSMCSDGSCCSEWQNKLIEWGVPTALAMSVSRDLEDARYDPNQFDSLQQLVYTQELQSYDWWTDLMQFFQQLLQQLQQAVPGIILTSVGVVMTYFLRNIKINKIPLALVGVAPMGLGIWMLVQPFLQPTVPTGG